MRGLFANLTPNLKADFARSGRRDRRDDLSRLASKGAEVKTNKPLKQGL